MGRWVLGAAVVVAWLGGPAASAQTLRDAASPGVTIQRAPAPARPVPPPIAPDPGPRSPDLRGQPRQDGPVDLFRAGPYTYAPRYDRRLRQFPYGVVVPYGYVGDSYYYPYLPAAASGTADPRPTPAATPGFLRLEIAPDTAQVFIDGFFVGGADDFGTARYPLEAGPHRVEIRASGFDSVTFDVRIRPYETATFTHTLERIDAVEPVRPAATVARAAVAKTLYVIPRCYAGDKRPVASDLPAGCSVRALRTIPPARP